MCLASKLHDLRDMGREVNIKLKEREKEPSMSIQKKSLISALKTTKKANIAKEDLSSPSAAPQDAKDLQAGRTHLQAGRGNLQGGKLQGGKFQGGKLQGGKL
jgi:hypothetical protein